MFERRTVLRSVMIIRPKSARRAVPVWSMRMLVYEDCQGYKVTAWNVVAHPFEISVFNFELVKIHYAMCHLGKL